MKDQIKVVARFRPGVQSRALVLGNKYVTVNGKKHVFDNVLDGTTSQEEVYDTCAKPIIKDILSGYNGTIFVYGQTSSGKTYTMEGELQDRFYSGLVPRVVEDLFSIIEHMSGNIEFKIKVSYYEIYMEKIRDLLDPSKTNLSIHEQKDKSTYVKNVSEHYVSTPQEILRYLVAGKRNRAVAVTNMNEHSSRSHSVFQLSIKQSNLTTQQKMLSKLYLVDLAGSESVSRTQAEGMILDQAKNINKSLLCLGKVISALSDSQPHVPYRDSKLTRVLQHSLGGNSRTTIIICMSLEESNDRETKSTLTFGSRAKCIKNVVTPNIELSLEELQAQYSRSVGRFNRIKDVFYKCAAELQRWRRGEVVTEEDQVDLERVDTRTEESKSETDLSSTSLPGMCSNCRNLPPAPTLTATTTVASHVTTTTVIPVIKGGSTQHKRPCLVNLNEDPVDGEYLSFDIPEGTLLLGNGSNDAVHIQLSGVLISDVHCQLSNRKKSVSVLVWSTEAAVFVNGVAVQVGAECVLTHGDRVIFGGSHYFRYTATGRADEKHNDKLKRVVDYEFAKAELINSFNNQKHRNLSTENDRLRDELHQLREKNVLLAEELRSSNTVPECARFEAPCTAGRFEEAIQMLNEFTENYCAKRVPIRQDSVFSDIYMKEEPLLSAETFNMYVNIKEANEMSRRLDKHILFSQETCTLDHARNDLLIRAENVRENTCILWTYETFKERLNAMKSYYLSLSQSTGQISEQASDSGVEDTCSIFGSDEVWQKDLSHSLVSDISYPDSFISSSFDIFPPSFNTREHPLKAPEKRKKQNMDVTSDYNSSNSSLLSSSVSNAGTDTAHCTSQQDVIRSVRDAMFKLLTETGEGVTSTVTMVTSSNTSKIAGLTEQLSEHTDLLNSSILNKKQELEKILSIRDTDTSTLESLLLDILSTDNGYYHKLNEISSWSRILCSTLSNKENEPTTTYHAARQLNEKLRTLQKDTPANVCSSPKSRDLYTVL